MKIYSATTTLSNEVLPTYTREYLTPEQAKAPAFVAQLYETRWLVQFPYFSVQLDTNGPFP